MLFLCAEVAANFDSNMQRFVFVIGSLVISCISAGVPGTQHIPLYLDCWASVLRYQCLYSLSIIDFILS